MTNRSVLVTTHPFAQSSSHPLDILRDVGAQVRLNPYERRLKEHELADLIGDSQVLIAGTEPITTRVMEAGRELKLIARVGIGLDSVDLAAARRRGILVSYTPDAPAPAVAELAVALMLNLLRGVSQADRLMHTGTWQRLMGRRLDGLTVGILGVGRIGKRVTRILKGGFPNSHIIANDLKPDQEFGRQFGVEWVELADLFARADIITVHVPLTMDTFHLIKAGELNSMKPLSFLINTSRGEILVEEDLAQALAGRRIAGAAVDVFEHEPYSGPLSGLSNCILTCHMGSMSEDCRAVMEREATEEAVRFFQGEALRQLVPDFEYAMAEKRVTFSK